MGKREVFDKIFIGVLGLVLVSVFIPCNQIDMVVKGYTKSSYTAILGSRIGFMHIVFPLVIAFILIWGKHTLASILGILLSIVHGVILYLYIDAGNYGREVLESKGGFSILFEMGGITDIKNIHPVGFYIAIVAVILLVLVSIIGFFIKDDEY